MKSKSKLIFIFVLALLIFTVSSCTDSHKAEVKETVAELQEETETDIDVETETEEFSGEVSISKVANIAMPGQAIDVDIKGNYAYVTDDLGQLYVIYISNKEEPKIINKVKNIDSANIVIIEDNYAYISYTKWENEEGEVFSECGFKILNVLDEKNPEILGNYISGQGTRKSVQVLFIEDNYAYVNSTEVTGDEQLSNLEIIDIENKSKPKLASTLEIEGMPWSVWADGDYAYINTSIFDQETEEEIESKLLIIDIKDKKNPKITGSCSLPKGTAGVYVKNGYAYVSNNTMSEEESELKSYLQIVDISEKTNPQLVGNAIIPGQGWELDMAGNYVFVSSLDGGVSAVDISNKEKPVIADSIYTSGTSYDITLEGNYGYIADGFSGLSIISLSDKDKDSSLIVDEENPKAIFEIFGDNIGEYSFPVGIPVYFSAASSYDPDGEKLDFKWEIENKEFEEEEISYIFNIPGEYEVSLEVSDGENFSKETKTVKIRETQSCIVPIGNRNYDIKIEYEIVNNSQQTLKELECFASTPQTYNPFQVVNEVNPSIADTDTVYDQSWNKITHFDLEGKELKPGASLKVSIICNIDVLQFGFLDIDYKELKYSGNDEDLILYTIDDLFIDSDNEKIRQTAKEIVGSETRPVIIMEKLYNFVIDHLSYDYQRAEDRNYPLLYASEILERGEGVCADYAILYTALLRASGIPSRVASGVPVYAMILEGNQLDVGHAWVEIKFPEFGWIPIDITLESPFMARDMSMNIVTQRGSGFLHKNTTMDWSSYYYDGFNFTWEGEDTPEVEQKITYSIVGD